jgi:hypothetical protein
LAGGIGSGPENDAAYSALLARRSSVTVIDPLVARIPD